MNIKKAGEIISHIAQVLKFGPKYAGQCAVKTDLQQAIESTFVKLS